MFLFVLGLVAAVWRFQALRCARLRGPSSMPPNDKARSPFRFGPNFVLCAMSYNGFETTSEFVARRHRGLARPWPVPLAPSALHLPWTDLQRRGRGGAGSAGGRRVGEGAPVASPPPISGALPPPSPSAQSLDTRV